MNDADKTPDTPGPPPSRTSGPPRPGAEGGDPACWLDQVCAACGRIRERPGGEVCEHCGASTADGAAADGAGGGEDDAAQDGGTGTPGTPQRRAASPLRRDRDEEGRARSARPRDGLGRPLPYGSPGVARQPEGVTRTPAQSLAEAQRLLDDGMPFHAHEVLEDAWKAAPEAERELWRGLAQLAVGLTHAARGNAVGGTALLDRGTSALAPYADAAPYGIDIAGLLAWSRELTGRLTGSGAVPAAETAPRLRTTGDTTENRPTGEG
ncbi:DUF309 domain-containing protein [Streptomyces sioyaensis]|uniref:DUF309 domain-containing protein n=1 Tax=Streptomyces sioyaensis TaxID=67364 RepID=UPI003F541D73